MSTHKVVILARGLGTRMKKNAFQSHLTQEQLEAAAAGMKAMMPIGRPFLDHCLSAYADAGLTKACLVIGPEHQVIREYYESLETQRISITFATQVEPLGTADAVLAAESFVGDDQFIMVNGDNYYPSEVIAELSQSVGSATVGFDSESMVKLSNIPPERIAAFALLKCNAGGDLADIIEKPSVEQIASQHGPIMVSMNCFCFKPTIFAAARTIDRSVRGEYEIVDAVRAMVSAGEKVEVKQVRAGVLDLSSSADVAAVESTLRNRPVKL